MSQFVPCFCAYSRLLRQGQPSKVLLSARLVFCLFEASNNQSCKYFCFRVKSFRGLCIRLSHGYSIKYFWDFGIFFEILGFFLRFWDFYWDFGIFFGDLGFSFGNIGGFFFGIFKYFSGFFFVLTCLFLELLSAKIYFAIKRYLLVI